MAVYPKAVYRPLNAFSNPGTRPRFGIALHVNDSGSVFDAPTSLFDWIAGDHGMSAHFQLMSNGRVEQYVDTDNGSWCQVAGNDTHISIETQGTADELMSPAMITGLAGLLAWLNQTHGIPLVVTDSILTRGIVGHSAGGAAWGGHPCPGVRLGQRRAAVTAAKALLTPPAPPAPIWTDEDMLHITYDGDHYLLTNGRLLALTPTGRKILPAGIPVWNLPAPSKGGKPQWTLLVKTYGAPILDSSS